VEADISCDSSKKQIARTITSEVSLPSVCIYTIAFLRLKGRIAHTTSGVPSSRGRLPLHTIRLYEHALEDHPMTAIGPPNTQNPNSMVSHHQPQLPPPPTDRALTARRPSSISSRSTTRRHRSSRSHHGSQSYRPQNEFPNFAQTGDVEIIIQADGQERRYTLHRLILAQCSGFFEAGTSEGWSRAQTVGTGQQHSNSLARIGEEDEGPGQRQVWRYELDWGNGQEDMPMLVQKVIYFLFDRKGMKLKISSLLPRLYSAPGVSRYLRQRSLIDHPHKPTGTSFATSLRCNPLPTSLHLKVLLHIQIIRS